VRKVPKVFQENCGKGAEGFPGELWERCRRFSRRIVRKVPKVSQENCGKGAEGFPRIMGKVPKGFQENCGKAACNRLRPLPHRLYRIVYKFPTLLCVYLRKSLLNYHINKNTKFGKKPRRKDTT
jgi:hypothetical protein